MPLGGGKTSLESKQPSGADSQPRELDDLVRVAFDLAPSGMLAVDDRGRVITANHEAERLFGWSRQELAGRTVETLIPQRLRAAHPGHRAGFLLDPHSRPMGAGRELYALRRDGTEFPVEIGLNPIVLPSGRYVLASIVDITTRREREEDLRRSQRLETIGIFAGGIAHDFNNILLGIVGHAELVLREGGISEQGRDDLANVIKAVERGRQLVQRILTFSREGGASRAPLRLKRIVDDAVSMLRASLPSTIEIRVQVDPATPSVLADETQIHQVLMNLATNSAHAMPDGGRIEIELGPIVIEPGRSGAGRYARLSVSDSGTGMSPDVLEHVLEPFYTTKPPDQGTGLGLSVVHGIVGSHGGFLAIDSSPGRGTTVTVDLPAVEHAVAEAPSASADRLMRRPLRILFVEDEAVLALMQSRQLESLGYTVTTHHSGVDALEDLRTRPEAFDLLITDETMPHMTGSVLAREVARIRPELPILMISGGDRTDPRKPLPQGVRKFLGKPHTAEELERAIEEVTRPGER